MIFNPLFNMIATGGMNWNSSRQSLFKYPLHHRTIVFPYPDNNCFTIYLAFPKTKLSILKKERHRVNFKLVKPRGLNHYSVYKFSRVIDRRGTIIFDDLAIIMNSC